MAYIQVGGIADGAADAAPSPARCARGRRSQAHAQTDKQNQSTGLPKSIEELFGKRRRNGANRAGCRGKPPKSEVYGDEAATTRAFAADPLGESPAYSVAPCLDFHRYASRYVTFGSSFITSGLTCPIYSPSIQHPKLSKSNIFLSSSP